MVSSSASVPTEIEHFKVRYKLWIGAAFLLLGSVTVGMSLRAMLLNGGFIGAAVLGLLLMVAGFLYLSRPYFAIAPNRLTIYNLIGSAVKRYPFESFGHLSIENTTLYIEGSNTGAAKSKVNIKGWMVRSADWKRLQALTNR
ncbi:MAG: hypothetical protein WBA76_04150 [Phormidesmis sp.]